MTFLNTFEKEEVQIHVKYEKIVGLLYTYAAKFLKNAGLDDNGDNVTAANLLDIDSLL